MQIFLQIVQYPDNSCIRSIPNSSKDIICTLEAQRAEQTDTGEQEETLLVGQRKEAKPAEPPKPTKPAVTTPVPDPVVIPVP